jgi:Lrp/AsnC family transcriptional regulator for asnA, asnC and gidA|tara:strand:+ start:5358 stop:5798 length:441 start_codon:yes stop_codon:yes gene_type:complete
MVDDLDNQIIEILSLDGRMSNASIARNLGVSEGTIRRRLNILKDEGIINVKVVLNPNYLASETEAIIGIQVDLSLIREVVLKLNGINEIRWVNITSGSFDIFINVSTKSLSDLLVLLQNKIGKIDGVKKIETFTTLDVPMDKLRGI